MTETPPTIRSSPSTVRAALHTQYSFKEERIGALFHLLSRHNRLKLSTVRRPKKVRRTNHPDYYLFHQMICNPTKNYRTLKITLQDLVDVGVLKLHPKQKTVALDTSLAKDTSRPSSYIVVHALLKDANSDIPALPNSDQ